jgi:hypothetical protein
VSQGKGGGRPTRYRAEFVEQAAKLCRLGATDKDLADFFGVTEKTINNWKEKHPKFLQSLKSGKVSADDEVEQSLYRRALGYSHVETKVFNHGGEIITKDVIKHYPPDATSMIFWLKNRRPEAWRDKQEIDYTDTGAVSQGEVPETDKALIREIRKMRAESGRTTH